MSREWYPWFPHRFWTSERVAMMDDAAVALYKFLLDHEWENGPFSSDERVLRAICSRFKSFETSWPQVLPCFKKSRHGKYFNDRMERERELEREAAHARAERSKNSWTKRRDAAESKPDARAEHVQTTRTPCRERVESSQPATDGRTDGRTDGPTYRPTYGGAGGPAPDAPPTAPRARKRGAAFEWQSVLSELPDLDTPGVRTACGDFCDARRSKHGAWTPQGMRIAIRRFVDLGPEALARAFEQATEAPWKTIYAPNALEHRNGHGAKRNGQSTETLLERRKREGMEQMIEWQKNIAEAK